MDKSNKIEVVQGDQYDAVVNITGRSIDSLAFYIHFKFRENDTWFPYPPFNPSGTWLVSFGNTTYNFPEGTEIEIDATGIECDLKLPVSAIQNIDGTYQLAIDSAVTNMMATGKYTYSLVAKLSESDEYMTPVYENQFEVLRRRHPLLPLPTPIDE